jgi:hypothetical protein
VARRLSLRRTSRIAESRTDVRVITGFRKIPKCALYYIMKFSELNCHKYEMFRLFMEHPQGVHVDICMKRGSLITIHFF